jgi:excinuclease ABC subunit C
MHADDDSILYVGKARDLKRRVASYFGSKAHHPKTQALMSHTQRVEVTVTASEQEALLLEHNLIKQHRPRFNVVLRDDKSYPYIRLTTQQEYPRFEFHRGSRRAAGQYFGPFPSAGSVRQVLAQLQKLFRVRQCKDSFFANRSRPCLQYQIARCTAPCVGLIDADDYRRDARNAGLFLEGRNDQVLADLVTRMESAASELAYETAAKLRDQIATIRDIQATQTVSGAGKLNVDVIGLASEPGLHCVSLIMIRNGRVLGSRNFFPRSAGAPSPGEIISAFIVQHYFGQQPPAEILAAEIPDDQDLLEQALSTQAEQKVAIRQRVRGDRRRWLEMAATNASQGLSMRRAANAGSRAQAEALADALALGEVPERIECFDVSHTGGRETVAACVVWGPLGALKSDYRRYNIKTAAAGDDYAAMAEAVRRRYTRVRRGEGPVPDLILIDGGKGQLKAAMEVLEELQFSELTVIGVAKGASRRPGQEQLFRPGESVPFSLKPDSPSLHLIQQVRDEAHRFAITGHRQRRGKQRRSSSLEEIAGLGPQRRRALLQQFGGLQGLRRAAVTDIAGVHGISKALAQRIFDHFHGGAED